MKKTALVALLAIGLFSANNVNAQKKVPHKAFTVLTVNDNDYWLEPSSINVEITEKDVDAEFSFTIHQETTGLYGFSIHGYGVGFPTYAILANENSGGAKGNQVIHAKVTNAVFTADGTKSKKYTAYLPIHIYLGSETGRDSNFLKLPITITVKPKKG
jgi:hypothetical protein